MRYPLTTQRISQRCERPAPDECLVVVDIGGLVSGESHFVAQRLLRRLLILRERSLLGLELQLEACLGLFGDSRLLLLDLADQPGATMTQLGDSQPPHAIHRVGLELLEDFHVLAGVSPSVISVANQRDGLIRHVVGSHDAGPFGIVGVGIGLVGAVIRGIGRGDCGAGVGSALAVPELD